MALSNFDFTCTNLRAVCVYLQREAAVRIGTRRLRLPGHLAPHVEASEDAVAPARVERLGER